MTVYLRAKESNRGGRTLLMEDLSIMLSAGKFYNVILEDYVQHVNRPREEQANFKTV